MDLGSLHTHVVGAVLVCPWPEVALLRLWPLPLPLLSRLLLPFSRFFGFCCPGGCGCRDPLLLPLAWPVCALWCEPFEPWRFCPFLPSPPRSSPMTRPDSAPLPPPLPEPLDPVPSPRRIIRPSTPTISAASSKLSSSIPSVASYTSRIDFFASRRDSSAACRQSYMYATYSTFTLNRIGWEPGRSDSAS